MATDDDGCFLEPVVLLDLQPLGQHAALIEASELADAELSSLAAADLDLIEEQLVRVGQLAAGYARALRAEIEKLRLGCSTPLTQPASLHAADSPPAPPAWLTSTLVIPEHSYRAWTAAPPPNHAPAGRLWVTPDLLARAKARADEAATLAAISASQRTSPTKQIRRAGHARSRHAGAASSSTSSASTSSSTASTTSTSTSTSSSSSSSSSSSQTSTSSVASSSKKKGSAADVSSEKKTPRSDGAEAPRRRAARRSSAQLLDADGCNDDDDDEALGLGKAGKSAQLLDFTGELAAFDELTADTAFLDELQVIAMVKEMDQNKPSWRRRRCSAAASRTQSTLTAVVSSDEDDGGEHDDSVTSPLKKSAGQSLNSFWSAVGAYTRNITEEDLLLLLPTVVPDDDPIWSCPALRPSRQTSPASSSATDGWQATPRHVSSTTLDRQSAVHPASSIDDDQQQQQQQFVSCGHLTERLLSALVEENLQHKSTKLAMRGPCFQPANDLPLSVPPTPSYSPAAIASLEERIRLELKSIGLLGASQSVTGSNSADSLREDDEISSEIRTLQSQLRDQIRSNNERKYRIYQLACRVMREQEKERHYRCIDSEIERIYLRAAQSEKRSKTRKRRH